MRTRRTVVLFMLGIGLMILPTAAGADTPAKAPPGFKTVKVKKAGFSIAIPKDWRTLNATSKTADDLLDKLKDVAPELVNQLPAEVGDLAAQNIVLMAFAPEPHEDFTANVNVLFLPDETNLPTLDELATAIRTIADRSRPGGQRRSVPRCPRLDRPLRSSRQGIHEQCDGPLI